MAFGHGGRLLNFRCGLPDTYSGTKTPRQEADEADIEKANLSVSCGRPLSWALLHAASHAFVVEEVKASKAGASGEELLFRMKGACFHPVEAARFLPCLVLRECTSLMMYGNGTVLNGWTVETRLRVDASVMAKYKHKWGLFSNNARRYAA